MDTIMTAPWEVEGMTFTIREDAELGWELIYRLVDDGRVVEVWSFSRIAWQRGIE